MIALIIAVVAFAFVLFFLLLTINLCMETPQERWQRSCRKWDQEWARYLNRRHQ